MNHPILPRIGTFLILVGCAFLIIFIGSVFARETHIFYFLIAMAGFFLGFILRRTPPPSEPTRFSGIRRAHQRSRQRREEKQLEKAQKK